MRHLSSISAARVPEGQRPLSRDVTLARVTTMSPPLPREAEHGLALPRLASLRLALPCPTLPILPSLSSSSSSSTQSPFALLSLNQYARGLTTHSVGVYYLILYNFIQGMSRQERSRAMKYSGAG
ncbi:hypothetical protein E2C01_067291 [Portunus trituberculatus]|uniref:Uncharacterized protein n=1 Tax=Portunus trituberculatus TaxID=210409 RepID=A0A5B7HT88_PORTR|nr:hypothetical protein [Portunus trituberculatus]